MKTSKKFYGLTLAVALTCFTIPSGFAHLEGDVPPPQCNLTALDGKKVEDWSTLKGEVVYVDFWASWCPPCIQSFPFMTQLTDEFKEKGLHVIGVNLDENSQDAINFLKQHPVNFSVLMDETKRCAEDFGVIAMPSTYIIDKNGLVRHIHRGFRAGEMEELRHLIKQLLAENVTLGKAN